LEYFFDPELNIAVVMLDMFNEELLDNNNRHLKFLSMEVQLLDEAVFIKKVHLEGGFTSHDNSPGHQHSWVLSRYD
jgi:hypothetical protein